MDRVQLRQVFSTKVEKFKLDDFTDPATGAPVEVFLRRLSGKARAQLGDVSLAQRNRQADLPNPNEEGTVNFQCRIVAQGLVDEHGARLYKDDELAALAEEFPATALDAITKEIIRLSGLNATAADVL